MPVNRSTIKLKHFSMELYLFVEIIFTNTIQINLLKLILKNHTIFNIFNQSNYRPGLLSVYN